jgi:hypothetical protein
MSDNVVQKEEKEKNWRDKKKIIKGNRGEGTEEEGNGHGGCFKVIVQFSAVCLTQQWSDECLACLGSTDWVTSRAHCSPSNRI